MPLESSLTDVLPREPTRLPLTALIMRLTIRARLAFSYGIVIAMVLVVVAVAVSAVHQRLGIARIDADLRAAMQSLAGVVASEINERLSLEVGARDRGYRDCQYDRSNREPGRQGSRISCKKNTRESISNL